VTGATGFNPLRWDCDGDGCFNRLKRPKIEVFAECLPGKLAFTDIDAMAEVNSRFLFLEWKGVQQELSYGQMIAFKRLTTLRRRSITVVQVTGSAETMEVDSWRSMNDGTHFGSWQHGDLAALKAHVSAWARAAAAAAPPPFQSIGDAANSVVESLRPKP
jgi:hypothetical protein